MMAVLKFQYRFASADPALDLAERAGSIVGMYQIEERSTHRFVEVAFQRAGERRPQPDEIALRVGNAEHVRRKVEEAIDTRFRSPTCNQFVVQLATEQLHLGVVMW